MRPASYIWRNWPPAALAALPCRPDDSLSSLSSLRTPAAQNGRMENILRLRGLYSSKVFSIRSIYPSRRYQMTRDSGLRPQRCHCD